MPKFASYRFHRPFLTHSLLLFSAAIALGSRSVQAQSFTAGDLVISRSTYEGTSGSVAFPGTLPNGAASVADGSFPNVFNNETPDASFGITSPIFLDQVTTSGVSTGVSFNVTQLVQSQLGANLSTSFPSKSELGLNLTPDGTALTFMAYGAAINQLDVSNSNTPGHTDITNPINSQGVLSYQRDIAEMNYQGSISLTTTNAYSGNNGRNVILGANGNYYMVGNAGNNGKSASLASGTVSFLSGSQTVTLSGASTTANMFVGMPVSGTGIASGAYLTSITDTTHFTISVPTTGASSGAYTANEGGYQLTGVNFSTASTTVTVADTSKLAVGMPLTGTGFAAGSYIQTITDPTHFVVNTLPTGSATGTSYVASVSNSMLSDNTGLQMIAKGSNDTTGSNVTAVTNSTAVGVVNGTYGTATGYQRGFTVTQVGAAADKTGKDDNFRGLADYNNTIYVTKGSGGNGFDGVYQVNPNGGGYVAPGTSAGLATGATSSTATINPLPGWPTTSLGANESKTGGATSPLVYHPFGIWFANDTTLYVGDEGLAGSPNAATGGLQKWTWNGSIWTLAYTIAASTIPGYNVTGVGNLQAEGLRNITGHVNGDGTVTIYGITSTTGQTLNDEGADPNQLVSLTDTLSSTTGTSDNFNVLETATEGDVLRGVSFAPTPEPGSAMLLAVGGAFLGGLRRRKSAAK